MKKLQFIKTALSDYKVGTLIPTGRYVRTRVIKKLRPGDKNILEYGAGDGIITKEILLKLPKDGKLIAVETNDKLWQELEKIEDARLTVLKLDVRSLPDDLKKFGMDSVDAIVSGIPFTFLNKEERESVVDKSFKLLNPGGKFIVYQISPLIGKTMKMIFGNIKTEFELRNIPPCVIMASAKKPA